jgi:predicted Zn finger-like uncharacterized protein
MRLVCPNCDAEYEVDSAAIPRAGRDVQCSNCGHAWFQLHPEVIAEKAEEEALFGAPQSDEADLPEEDFAAALEPEDVLAGDMAAPEDAPEPAAEPAAVAGAAAPPLRNALMDGLPDLVPDPALAASAEPVAPAAPAQSRNIDESILAVLREEAARETAARRAEAPPALETQTEMALDPAVTRRVARLKGEAEAKPVSAGAAPALGPAMAPSVPPSVPPPVPPPVAEAARSRRDLLPAIEEINSTLRATSDRGEDGEGDVPDLDAPATQKGGFGRGFLTLVLFGVILLALYVFAPLVAEKVPALAGVAASYIAGVDAARAWVDGEVRSLIGMLRGLEGSSQG